MSAVACARPSSPSAKVPSAALTSIASRPSEVRTIRGSLTPSVPVPAAVRTGRRAVMSKASGEAASVTSIRHRLSAGST